VKTAIAWIAKHGVAANLLMVVILAAGALGMMRTKQEVFPSFQLDAIAVSVPYPGASPNEVEQGIVLAVEESVRAVDGVKRVTSTSSEGVGTVMIELLIEADPNNVLNDLKTEVDRIQSFPEEAEEPSITLVSAKRTVVSLVISGDAPAKTLFESAELARDRMLESPDITQVEVRGLPPLEVAIELDRTALESYGMTLDEVAAQIRFASLELPGGEIDTDGGSVLVRIADRKRSGPELSELLIRSTATGAQVRLGDIATVRDGFAEQDLEFFYDGKPAIQIIAYRVGDETPTKVSAATHEAADSLRADLPGNLDLAIWDDDSKMLEARIDLLLRNARLGLLLVLVILALFLDLRLAFWTGMGIPISFLGAFAVLPSMGVTINMVSLFAFIVTLGLVVDDAIIVGENAYTKFEKGGVTWLEASIEGGKEMAAPVTFAILTTIAAFMPLLFVPGFMGKLFGIIPYVTIAVLFFSLIESFFVLPAHLGHSGTFWKLPIFKPINRVQRVVSGSLQKFIKGPFTALLRVVLAWRGLAMGAALALFVVTIGMLVRGTVPFSFFPKLEGDVVVASARLPYGAPVEASREVQELLAKSADAAIAEFGEEYVVGRFSKVGEGADSRFGPTPNGSHLVSLNLQLAPTGDRPFSSKDFKDAWTAATPDLDGVEALSFSSSNGPGGGAAVYVQLSHRDEAVLAAASDDVANMLRGFEQLGDVTNEYAGGKAQLDFSITPAGRNLNLTSNDVARQVRSAFFGAEALREQRGRHELKVMTRLPVEQRRSLEDLEQLKIRTAQGGWAPLSLVADVTEGKAPTSITREDGRRVVGVSAELAAGVRSSRDVLAAITPELERIRKQYPGVEAEFAGEQREQGEVFSSLGPNYLLALFLIYALLAIPFKSYTQPLLVMAAIPFGFVGAVLGHLLMGYELSIISMFGVVALTGVVVNDSLVLIDATNKKRAEGAGPLESIIYGATRRFRPILLTSLTTFFGLAPMILETDTQARFLVPMAISLGFGVLFATIIILLLVPALYMLLEDVKRLASWRPGNRQALVEEVAK
jgi:multidrug efflux pump subunit AcrB